jgi:hypothetical protein
MTQTLSEYCGFGADLGHLDLKVCPVIADLRVKSGFWPDTLVHDERQL